MDHMRSVSNWTPCTPAQRAERASRAECRGVRLSTERTYKALGPRRRRTGLPSQQADVEGCPCVPLKGHTTAIRARASQGGGKPTAAHEFDLLRAERAARAEWRTPYREVHKGYRRRALQPPVMARLVEEVLAKSVVNPPVVIVRKRIKHFLHGGVSGIRKPGEQRQPASAMSGRARGTRSARYLCDSGAATQARGRTLECPCLQSIGH